MRTIIAIEPGPGGRVLLSKRVEHRPEPRTISVHVHPGREAEAALELLRHARDLLDQAGATKAAPRLRAVIPSAEGAVRAQQYRRDRAERRARRQLADR